MCSPFTCGEEQTKDVRVLVLAVVLWHVLAALLRGICVRALVGRVGESAKVLVLVLVLDLLPW